MTRIKKIKVQEWGQLKEKILIKMLILQDQVPMQIVDLNQGKFSRNLLILQ